MINSYGGKENAPLTGKPLVLAGRVPVHVTMEGGVIKPGDYLTASSTPGYAMKATHAGPTIGKSYGFYDGTSGNTVLALINVSYYDPNDGQHLQADDAVLNSLTVNGAMNAQSINVGGLATVGSLNVIGSANIGGDLSVGGSLTVTGATSVVDITVKGHIITAGSAPNVMALTAAGEGATVTVNGNDTSGAITITMGSQAQPASQTSPAVPGPVAGEIVQLAFAKAFGQAPRVLLSPNDRNGALLGYYVSSSGSTGFVLSAANTPIPLTTYTFTYHVEQ
jgi:hypothetical protein